MRDTKFLQNGDIIRADDSLLILNDVSRAGFRGQHVAQYFNTARHPHARKLSQTGPGGQRYVVTKVLDQAAGGPFVVAEQLNVDASGILDGGRKIEFSNDTKKADFVRNVDVVGRMPLSASGRPRPQKP